MKTILFFGGRTPEHDVSVASAVNVLNGLDKKKHAVEAVYIAADGTWSQPAAVVETLTGTQQLLALCGKPVDIGTALRALVDRAADGVAFPVMHGPYGEDGTIQGLFEMIGMPYVGNGVLASAAAMDKAVMKSLFAQAGIEQTPWVSFRDGAHPQDIVNAVARDIGFPAYVKPANMGSSVGVARCADGEELLAAAEQAFRYDEKIVVEREVNGREIILAMAGDEYVRCSLPGVWQRPGSFFSYSDKYQDDDLTPRIPADIPEEVYRRMCDMGRRAFRAVDGSALMRADFFVTAQGQVLLNEVNTMPGFTAHSMFPLLCTQSWGMGFSELLDLLVDLGLRRHARRAALCREVHA